MEDARCQFPGTSRASSLRQKKAQSSNQPPRQQPAADEYACPGGPAPPSDSTPIPRSADHPPTRAYSAPGLAPPPRPSRFARSQPVPPGPACFSDHAPHVPTHTVWPRPTKAPPPASVSLSGVLPGRACALRPRPPAPGPRPSGPRLHPGLGVGARQRGAHALSAAPPTRRSAPLGHFRLFVLNSRRVFSPAPGGDPEGAASPYARRCPARPARSQLSPQVSDQRPARPGLRRPLLRPRPRPESGPGGSNPARAPAPPSAQPVGSQHRSAGPGGRPRHPAHRDREVGP